MQKNIIYKKNPKISAQLTVDQSNESRSIDKNQKQRKKINYETKIFACTYSSVENM